MERKIRKHYLHRFMLVLVSAMLFFTSESMAQETETSSEEQSEAPKETELYSKAAVLLDAESGRVLYEKNGQELLSMASTTKILTCIVALENGNLEDVVCVSQYASTMPDVQLTIREGEEYYLKDLLYSLMLESHNDTAVAIAEHVGGSVEEFAGMMNQKARDIGCFDSYFITPNGLDATAASQDGKITYRHATTAEELAKIMAYCIRQSPQKEAFLEITRTASYAFSDLAGKRNFNCNNHNAFLGMMEGALSGKTGFTGSAGYCYVGALERDGKVFTVALLACGWPNHKTYKWSDTKKLMNYGLDNYEYHSFDEALSEEKELQPVTVRDAKTGHIGETAKIPIAIAENGNGNQTEQEGLLLRGDEEIQIVFQINQEAEAPVVKGDPAGSIQYLIKGEVFKTDKVIFAESIDKIDFIWCVEQVSAMMNPFD